MKGIIETVTNYISKNKATVYSILAGVGVVGTGVVSSIAAIHAVEEIAELGAEQSPKNITKVAIKHGILPVGTAVATICCIGKSHMESQSALAAATLLAENYMGAFRDYRNGVLALPNGEEIDKQVMEELVHKNPEYRWTGNNSNDSQRVWIDAWSGHRFICTEANILDAEYHTNRNMQLKYGWVCPVTEWYEMLGCSPDEIREIGREKGLTEEELEQYGWSVYDIDCAWVDFYHNTNHEIDSETGLEICYVHFEYSPVKHDEDGNCIDDGHMLDEAYLSEPSQTY